MTEFQHTIVRNTVSKQTMHAVAEMFKQILAASFAFQFKLLPNDN